MSGPTDQVAKNPFEQLEERLNYRFSSFGELERALTHSSFRRNSDDRFHYERLEFLGDRVLGLCVADTLCRRFPDAEEGELSLRLNALVKGETLAEIADELKLHEYIRTGGDLKSVTGKRMQSVRADVMEAVIASVYLDGGLEAARDLIAHIWGDRFLDVTTARRDSKTALQEWAHAGQMGTPKYRETEKSGPDHEPVFTVEVKVSGKIACKGTGRSKRLAEQEAARAMLVREGIWNDDAD
ncbi:MAG: ribonuclease III [Pseudomonadota bacterium]